MRAKKKFRFHWEAELVVFIVEEENIKEELWHFKL